MVRFVCCNHISKGIQINLSNTICFASNHHPATKIGIIICLRKRAISVQKREYFKEELQHLTATFRSNGYTMKLIRKALHKQKKSNDCQTNKEEGSNQEDIHNQELDHFPNQMQILRSYSWRFKSQATSQVPQCPPSLTEDKSFTTPREHQFSSYQTCPAVQGKGHNPPISTQKTGSITIQTNGRLDPSPQRTNSQNCQGKAPKEI